MTAKVLITEEIDVAGVEVLKDRGISVDQKLNLSEQELIECIVNYEGLIIRSHTMVTKAVVDAAKNLRVIGRAGISIDNVDLDAATQAGIVVCNVPNSNITSQAEMAMALLLSCARNIPQANDSMHKGQWTPEDFKGCELFEKTLAIYGLGRAGGMVAQRAAAFGMNLIAYDPYCSHERAATLGVELYDNLNDLLPFADFITVHVPKTKETEGMFGPEQFAAMKDGVIIANVSSDGIFDERSMADFIAAGKIRSVGFDSFKDEPCLESPLHEFSNAILTPHIAALTDEAQKRTGVQIATYVAQAINGSIVPTAINMSHVPPEVMDKFGPYLTAAQKMGRIISQIDEDIPHKLRVSAAGTLASIDLTMLLACALKGLMDYKKIGAVNGSNAQEVAQRHGIETILDSTVNANGYDSSLSLVSENVSIACTVYGTDRPARIIEFFGYSFDIQPAARSLVVRYKDAPGRVGVIGTILGQADINITTMQIGTREDSDSVMVFINVEGDISDEVIQAVRDGIDGLEDLWCLSL